MAQGTTKGVPIDKDPLLNLDSDLVVPSQKAIKAYVDAKKSAADSDYVNVSGDVMTGFLTLNADPTINLHAATKQYVDNYINGLDYKKAADATTINPLPACTATTQTLTGNANGAITSSITDGYTLLTNNRVLVKNQVATANNGIYVVTRTGDASTTFLLTRADDANTGAELGEATLSIINGSTLANTIWHCTPDSPTIVLGTTGLTFIQVGSGSVGTGTLNELTYWSSSSSLGSLTGNITTTKKFLSQTGTGSAITSAPTWEVLTKTDVDLANVENTALSTWVGSTSITTLGTISSGTWNGTTIAVANGGTGANTLTGVVIGNGTSPMTAVAGTASQVLRRKADNSGYEFADPTTGVTDLTYTASTRLLESSTGTDVTLPLMVGATASVAGIPGLVPAAAIGQQSLYLTGAGTWATQVATGTITAGTDRRLGIYQGGTTTLASTTSGANAVIISIDTATGARTYNVPDAGANAAFVMTQGTQTIAGSTTFNLSAVTGTAVTINALAGSVTNPVLSVGAASTAAYMSFPNTTYIAAPSSVARSAGTKIVLYPTSNIATISDVGLGIETFASRTAMWLQADGVIKFYPNRNNSTSGSVGQFEVFTGTPSASTPYIYGLNLNGNSTGSAPNLLISGAANNYQWLSFGSYGQVGGPNTSARSQGTKIVLFQSGNLPTSLDTALGLEASNALWLSSFSNIKFYPNNSTTSAGQWAYSNNTNDAVRGLHLNSPSNASNTSCQLLISGTGSNSYTISFGLNPPLGAPSSGAGGISIGKKIVLQETGNIYTSLESAIGRETGYMWFQDPGGIRFYTNNSITARAQLDSTAFNIVSGTVYQVAGTKVVGARVTGWGAPTGTINRAAFTTTASVVYNQAELTATIQALKAVITDLQSHGLIGT